ncbi:MAG TPA: PadR family transcriptional regulator [Thermoanaerobaculia bacterium]|nr:PadR family transcriptional regulator [Thermoanaerobaculia bacterium]
MRRRRESTRPSKGAGPETFLPLPHLPFHVLLALAEEPRHGWAIIRAVRQITSGRDNPSSGSLYLAMSRLVERGLIEEAPGAGIATDRSGRRKTYRLTGLGREVLEAETARLATLVRLSEGFSTGGKKR